MPVQIEAVEKNVSTVYACTTDACTANPYTSNVCEINHFKANP